MGKQKSYTNDWNVFRETGLLVFVNVFLHIFGYAIILEVNELDEIRAVYPKKVNYYRFNQDSMDKAYERIKKLTKNKQYVPFGMENINENINDYKINSNKEALSFYLNKIDTYKKRVVEDEIERNKDGSNS